MFIRNLFENSSREVALIFGRFNPPHKGHRAAWEMASQSPVWYVGTNKSTQGPKDPLPFDIKIKAMKAVWPEVESHIIAETSWLTAASMIYKKHGDVVLLCLTDEDWVTNTIKNYNGKEGTHGYYNFSNIEQKPTPRLSSATALRDAVIKGDKAAFSQAAGVAADIDVDGKPFFDLVAEYLLPYQNAVKKVVKKKKEPAVEDNGISKEKENKFHSELDKLVHKTFGKSKDELEQEKKSSKVDEIDDFDRRYHRDFKRRELSRELGHEDDPDFQRSLRQQEIDRDRGPWYIKIDGKIYKQKGLPKSFEWRRGANNYALAIIKNRPDLKDKIVLTKKLEESKSTDKITTLKPRQGPLRTQTGSGVHRDKKKEQKSGKEKHKKPFAEDLEEGSKKLSTQEKFLRNLKGAGFDVDAFEKKINDILNQQQKEPEKNIKINQPSRSENKTKQFETGTGISRTTNLASNATKEPIVATLVINGQSRTLDLTPKGFNDVREAEKWIKQFMKDRGIMNWQGKIERSPGSQGDGTGRYQSIRIIGAGGLESADNRIKGVAEGKKNSDELAKYENDVKTLLANGDVKTAKKVAGLSPDAAHRNHLRNIIRRYDSKKGVSESGYPNNVGYGGIGEENKNESRGLAPVSNYVELMQSLGLFMSITTSTIEQDAADNSGAQELKAMQRQFNKPVMNGKTFFEIMGDNSLFKNPKVAKVLVNYAYTMIPYIEARIKKYVKPEHQAKWQTQIDKLKNHYRAVATSSAGKQGVAEGKLTESAIFLNNNTAIVGQDHGKPLNLSPETLKKVQAIAKKYGAWYEGNGTDRAYTRGVIDKYEGSWDDEVAQTASVNDPKWLYVLFANVDANNRVQRVGINPQETIFDQLLSNAEDNSYQGIGFTSQALQKFLSLVSEGQYDFVKMSQLPATKENLTKFLKAGESLMWPSNWEQYPNRAGKIAKAATVDARDQYLATRKAGVYVVGSGHLKAVQNITGKQGVAEGLRDPKDNPCWKGYKPVGTKKKNGRTVPNCVPVKENNQELDELFDLQQDYYKLSDGQIIRVEYRQQGLSPDAIPKTVKIKVVDPKIVPTGAIGPAIPWDKAKPNIKQAIINWVESDEPEELEKFIKKILPRLHELHKKAKTSKEAKHQYHELKNKYNQAFAKLHGLEDDKKFN